MSAETLLIQTNDQRTTKGGKQYHLITAGGRKFSCWAFDAASLQTGTTWLLETEQKGNFWNITKILSQQPAPPAAQTPEQPPDVSAPRDATRVSIERQSALKAAVEMAGHRIAAGAEVSAQDTLRVAQAFTRFLETGLVPVAVTAPVSPAEGSTTTQAPTKASRPGSASHRAYLSRTGAAPTGQSGEPMPEDDSPPF